MPTQTLTRFLKSDDATDRRLAAWIAGLNKEKSLKPLLHRLAERDQAFDDRTLHYPVRDAANQALNKIDF